MLGRMMLSSTPCSLTFNHLCRLDMLEEGMWNLLPLRPVMSIPQGECLPAQLIPNPHDIHLFFMGRQLIQELRLKREKKPFQMKKKVEMQGESAGEQVRKKGVRGWQQKQQQKDKAATQASKQVNPDHGEHT